MSALGYGANLIHPIHVHPFHNLTVKKLGCNIITIYGVMLLFLFGVGVITET